MSTVPETMAAVVLTGHGGLDKLEYRTDWPTPTPGLGEVLVKVGACGLNNTDINTRTAWYSASVTDGITEAGGRGGYSAADTESGSWGRTKLEFPRIQGCDVAGTVAAVGQDVDPNRIGERVIVDIWKLDPEDPMDLSKTRCFGSETDGGYAQYTRVPSKNAVAIDCNLSTAELATFPCAYATAENLIRRTDLERGETVVITGASGGVGSAAIQLCRVRGARVIAIAAASKAEQLKGLGAEAVIDRNQPNLSDAVLKAAGGEVEVALDVVGGAMFQALVDVLRQGGRYSSSGAIAGPIVELDLRQLVYKDLQFTGATIVPHGVFQRVVGCIESGQLKPLLAATYPLHDLAKAQEAFMAKRHVGNIVVTLDQDPSGTDGHPYPYVPRMG